MVQVEATTFFRILDIYWQSMHRVLKQEVVSENESQTGNELGKFGRWAGDMAGLRKSRERPGAAPGLDERTELL